MEHGGAAERCGGVEERSRGAARAPVGALTGVFALVGVDRRVVERMVDQTVEQSVAPAFGSSQADPDRAKVPTGAATAAGCPGMGIRVEELGDATGRCWAADWPLRAPPGSAAGMPSTLPNSLPWLLPTPNSKYPDRPRRRRRLTQPPGPTPGDVISVAAGLSAPFSTRDRPQETRHTSLILRLDLPELAARRRPVRHRGPPPPRQTIPSAHMPGPRP